MTVALPIERDQRRYDVLLRAVGRFRCEVALTRRLERSTGDALSSALPPW